MGKAGNGDSGLDTVLQRAYYMPNMASYNLGVAVDKIHNSGLKIFSLHDLSRLLEISVPRSARAIASRLVRINVLARLEKNRYMTVNPPPARFTIANLLFSPSYVSLETALNYHGILSQFPYEITSVTPKKSTTKQADGQVFSYAHIKPDLFWGYEKIDDQLIALPEKALLDQLYLSSKGLRTIHLDEYDLSRVDKSRFYKFSQLFPKLPLPKL